VTKRKYLHRLTPWILAAAILAGLGLWATGNLGFLSEINREQIRSWVEAAGVWGPLLIVVLMSVAIVASPLPSAPVALAAGAAYGDIGGTLLVALGAEIGAIAAFLIARKLGRSVLQKWLGERIDAGLLGSQNALTLLVFTSRLLPFVSFDMISYAAGLSAIRFWRFAIATLAGIVPASFILAHLGREAMNGDASTAGWTAALLGLFTLISIGAATVLRRRKPDDKKEDSP
jgi:uncharacterized membrane protein YdjX (TVP38/TMEM64 family)